MANKDIAKHIKQLTRNSLRGLWLVAILVTLCSLSAWPQYYKSELRPPAPAAMSASSNTSQDTTAQDVAVKKTAPQTYEDLMKAETPTDLSTPTNISTVAEFDPATGCYIVRTRVGNYDIATPFILSEAQYNDWQTRKTMQEYYRKRNSELIEQKKEKQPFDILDMNFALGPLEKIFGPGGVSLKTQGSIKIDMGIKSTKTDNPTLSLNSRRKTFFDFDQKIQATISASVGDRMKFNMTYNTNATFDFDSKNIKLQYEGKEDDIVKSIEAGNVSMSTGSQLIRGATSLFGVKAKLQFGRLTATALVSQQNSESKSINTKGGVQTTQFTIEADDYDQNRHFFLSQFFRENYDSFASKLPYVSSGVQITRVEIWVTNKNSNFAQSRNIVAFADLGESTRLTNNYWTPNAASPNPTNASNNLLSTIKTQYPDARNINNVTQELEPLAAFGIHGGVDYEKVESARILSESEYTLNTTLGYVSFKSQMNTDEVVGIAYEYTYNGKVYQVGEFSSDITSSDQSLYVKMLKGTTVSPQLPVWDLMMKNIYSLGAYQLQNTNFKLQIKYLSDTTGTMINYIPAPNISNVPLLQVMNLDRLDSNQTSNPDGFFDYIEGYTILSSSGKVIFPVVEPFGSHLAQKIGDPAIAEKFTYQQLYDSTLVVAQQFADKNKFVLTGEYQASAGSQIRLNAMNVPRGSVIVTAGGVTLTENSDYTVDYAMGIVTITNQSIIDSGQDVSVTLENQSMFSMQRKTLLGLDLSYKFNRDLTIGGTVLHYGEKALTEKVNIGDEIVNNTIWGFNFAYNKEFMWLTNLLNKVPTINATAPSKLSLKGEFAQLIPHAQKSGSTTGSSYIDDFESAQNGIDLRSPYSWFLASTPYDNTGTALFPEASLSNNADYGKNRALLNWYYIDRMFTSRNSSLAPGYIKSDLKQLSNPYVREVTSQEIYPNRQITYGESSNIQTLNLSFYPSERGPYNLDGINVNSEGFLTNPEKRWGGIMRRLDNTDFEQSNIEYVQFWLLNPFLDPENPNYEGGDLYLNFGELSEDILKDGLKSYENGLPYNGNNEHTTNTIWGRVSTENSLSYAFDNSDEARKNQDLGLDGLNDDEEYSYPTYSEYVSQLRRALSPEAIQRQEADPFSPLNDPAGDNYHFYRGYDYDEQRVSILDRYKRYNGVEGNSLSPNDASDALYQSARSMPDVEDINQDNTLNEYERYYQYRVSIRPEDFVVGKNYITDKQVTLVPTRDGGELQVEWYQFKIPLADYEKVVGSINGFTTMRFMRMFMTGFKKPTHLRFASLELVRGEWRPYEFNLNSRGESPADGNLDVSVVNIEENSGREPVNYVLPPGVSRIVDPGQSQMVQLNEQSLSLKVTDLNAGDARAVYRNTSQDLRNYKSLQMWVHAEALINDHTGLRNGDLSVFVRLGSDVRNNYYEYEVPLKLTPHGHYVDSSSDRATVWPEENFMNITLQNLVDLKKQRNQAKRNNEPGVGFGVVYYGQDPDNNKNRISVKGNPSLSDVRVLLVGVRNNSSMVKDGVVWINELKVTDFESEGGWAADGTASLSLSDIATVNLGAHYESAGFGAVDQSLNERRMDEYSRYTVSVQTDLGRFLPEKAQLRAPIFYSMTKEKTTPKYNPLDQDVRLDEALEGASKAEQDSIKAFAIENSTQQNFSISGLNFNVKSENPMPWDPANFTLNFSFNKSSKNDPTTEYENLSDYRGSFQYTYTPYIKGLRPFSKIKSKSKNMRFVKDWELNWFPNSISFLTTMSRYYYEEQARATADVGIKLPVSVSKNFLWDRQLAVTWNITKSLSLTFNSNTAARIEEPVGAVNKKLFPDRYREWRDSVWSSILHMGTPWSYNQTFVGTYKAPFSRIPVLDFLTANLSYNSTYRWDRGATIDNVNLGNTIANQASWSADGRINLEKLYNKNAYLKQVNTRFAAQRKSSDSKKSKSSASKKDNKPKRFERTFALKPDSTITIKHNLRTKKVKVSAVKASDNTAFAIKSKVIDANTVEILTTGTENIKFKIVEIPKDEKTVWENIGEYAARFAMSPRNVSVRWRDTRSMSIPLFAPNVGNVFGQTGSAGPLAPGLDFAFGFVDESYITTAKERGWLLCADGQTSPATYSHTNELNVELTLEPIKGLKIQLTSNRTDNRSSSIQFMYDDMPTALAGSYTKTHCAIATALASSSADNGYYSNSFNTFINNIPVIAQRVEEQYYGLNYPTTGFMEGNASAGQAFNPEVGTVSQTSSDVLIPAFLSAYTGTNASKQYLDPFPSFAQALPNWRVTYDGLTQIPSIGNIFKSLTLTHAYQCTYSVGSYSSYLNWISADGKLGFTLDELTGRPIPSSPYNISSVAITERFAPLIGASATLKNNMTFNAEFRESRTLTLNSSAGQVVEASQRGITAGFGYKIVGFNSVLKLKGKQQGVSNDLTINADFSYALNQALIRKIENAYTQATSGTRTISFNVTANYILSKRMTLGMYFEHQINTPLVSSSAYPTTNTAFGISFNFSLAR